MNEKLLDLAARRGALGVRIASQRAALAQHTKGLESLLDKGDAALQGIEWLKQHPLVVGASVAVIAIARPARALRWTKRGFFLWRGWQFVRKNLDKVR
jgi:hypothetical protein